MLSQEMKDKIRVHLTNGGSVNYHVWNFTAEDRSCSEGCCNDYLSDIEEAMETIEIFCRNEEEIIFND